MLTIENSRSGDAMVAALAAASYGKDLGPGVYDVHSPQVPEVDWLVEKVQGFVDSGVLAGRYDRVWVNPGARAVVCAVMLGFFGGGLV